MREVPDFVGAVTHQIVAGARKMIAAISASRLGRDFFGVGVGVAATS